MVLPTPGGKAPDWIRSADDAEARRSSPSRSSPRVVIALVVHVGLMRSSYGAVLRGAGGNPRSVARAGWSMLRVKVTMFALAGFFGVLSGIALIGLTTSADANIALRYTLLSIAGVILGGGEFVGGRVSPVGAVIGAHDPDARGLVPLLPAPQPRLADRRPGRDPDHRPGAPRAHLAAPRRARHDRACAPSSASPGSGPGSARSRSGSASSSSPAARAARASSPPRSPSAPSTSSSRIGQMFVVTLGPGNVDLSIPACMTLAGTVAMKMMDEANGAHPPRPRRLARDRRSPSARSTTR